MLNSMMLKSGFVAAPFHNSTFGFRFLFSLPLRLVRHSITCCRRKESRKLSYSLLSLTCEISFTTPFHVTQNKREIVLMLVAHVALILRLMSLTDFKGHTQTLTWHLEVLSRRQCKTISTSRWWTGQSRKRQRLILVHKPDYPCKRRWMRPTK